jgi:putative DNA primase/helicase
MTTAPVQAVLDRLRGVKSTGVAKWIALCPVHEAEGNGHRPSLSIGQGDDGRALVNCMAGCATGAVVNALGLKMADLFPPKADAPQTAPRRIVKTYNYLDETGALLFQTVRFEPKDFQQRRPDGAGGWTWNLKGVRRVLYRLPQLLAADPVGWVFVVEGEKDADALAALGLVATTNPGGAGKWKNLTDDSALHDHRVCILPDKDSPGRAHAQDVARRLHGKATDVRIVELPDVGGAPVKDASDWIEAQDAQAPANLAVALLALADAATTWTPTAESPPAIKYDSDDIPADGDVRLGREFVAAFAERVRYCPDLESWLVWDGRRWARDAVHEAERLMQNLARDCLAAAADLGAIKGREAEARFWLGAMRRNRIEAGLWTARSDPRLVVRLADLDGDSWALNVCNGTLNLKTGCLRHHAPADLITRLCPAAYNPHADRAPWDGFLSRVLPDDRLRSFLQRAVGYSITGLAGEEVLFFVCGPTASGKSTFVSAIRAAVGDYGASANFESFLASRNVGGPRSDLVRLAGRRFVASVECDEAGRLAGGLLKWISGQDPLCVRSLYETEVEYLPAFKLWLVSNHRPRAADDDSALWRRLLLVPFEVSIPEDERNPEVKRGLSDSAIGGPAVLAWAVEGCRQWQREGLKAPDPVLAATRAWRAENDPLADWLNERTLLDPAAAEVFADLNRDYRSWAEAVGLRPISGKKLGGRLQNMGCQAESGAGGRRVYVGIRLKIGG